MLKNTKNLFRTDGIALFDLWNLPINFFSNQVNMVTTSTIMATEKNQNWIQRKFLKVSSGLGTCIKAKTKFKVKENATPVFSPKRSVPLVALDPINKELERLEDLGVISKVDYSEWALPTVYMKKKNNKIHVYADFSKWLNDSLQNYNYLLPSPEEIFAKLSSGNYFLSWTCCLPRKLMFARKIKCVQQDTIWIKCMNIKEYPY